MAKSGLINLQMLLALPRPQRYPEMGSEGPHPSWGALGQGRHLILYRSEKAFSAPGMGALGREVMWKGTQSLVSALRNVVSWPSQHQ